MHPPVKPFHKPHTSIGASGRYVHLLGLLATVAISERIHNPTIRMVSMAGMAAALSIAREFMWQRSVQEKRGGRELG